MPVNPISNATLTSVGQSWIQTNGSVYGITKVPVCRALDRRSGRLSTTYELPALDNSLNNANGLLDWEPGQALPVERGLASSSVTFTPRGVTTPILARPVGRDLRQTFRDLEVNIVPVVMTELMGGMERDLYSFLSTAGNWGGAQGFSNGAGGAATSAVDQFGGDAVQPDQDINVALRPLRKYQSLNGMALECYTNSHVLDVLSRHPAYTGAGTGSAIASKLPMDAFVERFMAVHRLNALHVMDSVVDTTAAGIASDPNFAANGLLWFGLIDRRGEMDLRTDGSLDAPDGALICASGREAEVASWITPGMETESFAGRASYQIFSPRGADFGVLMKPSGVDGIFATLPS